jgi:GT2 family glycosyltransferase
MLYFFLNGVFILEISRFSVSVIVVNYNCHATLQACIGSILLSKNVGELLLVDNASTDDSMEPIKKYNDSRLKIISLNRNIGLAAARNLAAAKARYNYLAFTDADIAVDYHWLRYPCLLLENHKEFGAVQCKLILSRQVDKIARSMKELDYYPSKDFPQEKLGSFYPILFPVGAAFVIRRQAWDFVKGFDPVFFIGNDDVDLGIRLWLSGYEVLASSEGIVYHEFGTLRSQKSVAPIFGFYGLRNMLYIWTKNLEGRTIVKQVFPFAFFLPFMAFRIGRIMGLKGVFSFIKNFKSILESRHEVQQLRKISDDRIIPMMHSTGTLPIQLFTTDFRLLHKLILRKTTALLRFFRKQKIGISKQPAKSTNQASTLT